MHPPDPVLVAPLFPEERARLLELLAALSPDQWLLPTACAGWCVKDVVAHLLADDLGKLSGGRDGFAGTGPAPGEALLRFINRVNEEWVRATHRLSPRVLRALLESSGEEVAAHFAALDPCALGPPVSWAGPDPAPMWLDVAREYTERWHHQAHIRDAVGAQGLTEPRLFAPVLATFVRALPETFRGVDAPEGTAVALRIAGESGGAWAVVREGERWALYAGTPPDSAARVSIAEDDAWRLFTRGLSADEAERAATIDGDQRLGRRVLDTVAIIA